MIKSFVLTWLIFPLLHFTEVSPSKATLDPINKTIFATYYHKKFEGRKTASGVRYRAEKLTAAHLTLPFGTEVTVTNPSNGKSVVVVVNDRGPHSKKVQIDLSYKAARELGIVAKGIAKVEISYSLDELEEVE